MRGLAGLTAGQLRKQVEAEREEIGQLRNQLSLEMAAAFSSGRSIASSFNPIDSQNLSERQALVRELQQLREEKIQIVEQIKALRAKPNSDLRKILNEAEKLEKQIKKRKEKEAREEERRRRREEREKKREEREGEKRKRREEKRRRREERERKKKETKEKLWNKKNLRKGSVSGERAHDRFQRYFDSKKISEADKDRMRRMLDDVGFYESDEVFQILSLMESKAFNNMDEAEEFLIDFYHIQKGQSAALETFRDKVIISFESESESEAAAESTEDLVQDFEINTGLELRF